MNDMALVLHNVETYYGKIHALKGISLEVPRGKIVTLLGSNGAGKTTTLQTISGLLQASSGKIEFYGRDIAKERAHNIVGMGLIHVPEGRRIFKDLTVKENLELGGFTLKVEALRRKRIEHVFEIFPRLKDRQKQSGGTLSGGEQQMLAIGRALGGAPQVLLLDEPMEGLSPIIVDKLYDALATICAEEKPTIVLVEQKVDLALAFAEEALVLDRGVIVHRGPASALVSDESAKRRLFGVGQAGATQLMESKK